MSSDVTRVCPTCGDGFEGGDTCPHDGARLIRVAPDPLLGSTVDGRFVVDARLGAGGMGQVYRARQLSVDRLVALKVVAPERIHDAQTARRFLREARIASRVHHPNTVTVFDSGQDMSGRLWLAMEFVQGPTLAELLSEEGPFEPERSIRLALQICDALDAGWRHSVVHRDLKPSNVIVCRDPNGDELLKVLDFGLARSLDSADDHSIITREGVVCGTPAYISPEAACADPTDIRADLYALGVMLFEMLEGRTPFSGGSGAQIMARHVTEPPPALGRTPRALARVVERLLEKLPDDRYPNPAVARAALEAAREQLEAPTGAEASEPAVAAAAALPDSTSEADAATDGTLELAAAGPRPQVGLLLGLVLLVVAAVGAWRWSTRAAAPDSGGASQRQSLARNIGSPNEPVRLAAPEADVVREPELRGESGSPDEGSSVEPSEEVAAPKERPRRPRMSEAESTRRERAAHPERVAIQVRSRSGWATWTPGAGGAVSERHKVPGTVWLPYSNTPVSMEFRLGRRTLSRQLVPDRDQEIRLKLPRKRPSGGPDFIVPGPR